MGAILAAGITAGLNEISNTIQYSRQKKLMEIQQQNQMLLNKQGQELQLDTWEKTNYPAQVGMLKAAGLNPALLYSKGGAGGTTGSQSGGSAASGAAPQAQKMDIGSIMQIKLMEANARKANAEATVIEKYGAPQAESGIGKQQAETANVQADTQNKELQNQLMDIERAWKPSVLEAEVKTAVQKAEQLRLANKMTVEEWESYANDIRQSAIGKSLENALTEVKTDLTGEDIKRVKMQTRAIATELAQKWTSLSQEQQKIELQAAGIEIAKGGLLNQNEITKFNTNWAAKSGQVTGIIGNIIRGSAGISSSSNTSVTTVHK